MTLFTNYKYTNKNILGSVPLEEQDKIFYIIIFLVSEKFV